MHRLTLSAKTKLRESEVILVCDAHTLSEKFEVPRVYISKVSIQVNLFRPTKDRAKSPPLGYNPV